MRLRSSAMRRCSAVRSSAWPSFGGGMAAESIPGLLRALDDVEAEGRLDDLAHLADLERERSIAEALDHRAPLEDAEVAAALRAAGLVAVFLDHLIEVGAAAELEEHLLG